MRSFDQRARSQLARLAREADGLLRRAAGLDSLGAISPTPGLARPEDEVQPHGRGGATGHEKHLAERSSTLLLRLCVLRLAQARGLPIELPAPFGHGLDAPPEETASDCRRALIDAWAQLERHMPALFDHRGASAQLLPPDAALRDLLNKLHAPELAAFWAQDETAGWLYQLLAPRERKGRARPRGKAPRDSYELALRSRYYTPRYVVEFLTDNTLGRAWHEMTHGQTNLLDGSRFFVRGRSAPYASDNRPLKDPRAIRVLDPACGTMHFGLYAYDLLERIYAEAWDRQVDALNRLQVTGYRLQAQVTEDRDEVAADGGRAQQHQLLGAPVDDQTYRTYLAALREAGWTYAASAEPESGQGRKAEASRPLPATYPSRASFLRDVPRLILEHNLYGVDIDPQAVQVAGSALWLRAQRSWQAQGLAPEARPQIRRANLVCAEPLPGDEALLEDFIARELTASQEDRRVADVLRQVFTRMRLASQAGSLLRIELEIGALVARAWQQPARAPDAERSEVAASAAAPELLERAEERIYESLSRYGCEVDAAQGHARLFAEGHARGVGLIELSRLRYDVVLMNPPFAETEGLLQAYLRQAYPATWTNLYTAFLERGMALAKQRVGVVCPDGLLSAYRIKSLRRDYIEGERLELLSWLGHAVFDNMGLPTIAAVLSTARAALPPALVEVDEDGLGRLDPIQRAAVSERTGYVLTPEIIRGGQTGWQQAALAPGYGTVTQGNRTFDDFRFVRAWWEVPAVALGTRWQRWQKGGEYQPFFSSTPYVVDWDRRDDGAAMRAFGVATVGTDAQVAQSSRYWGRAGLVGPALTGAGFNLRVLPAGQIFSAKSTVIIPRREEHARTLLGLLNARHLRWYLHQQGAGLGGNTGKLKRVPISWPDTDSERQLNALASSAIEALGELESLNELSPYFHDCLRPPGPAIARYRACAEQLDALVGQLYQDTPVSPDVRPTGELVDSAVQEALGGRAGALNGTTLISYCAGVAFGRWDVRAALDGPRVPLVGDPFAPLPTSPPGMLLNARGLPAMSEAEVVGSYPLAIPWDGVLVDDPGHPRDLVAAIRQVLELLRTAPAHAAALAQYALEDAALRHYLRRPSGFFADHLARYARTRRQAPIYWPLATPSGSYTLWIYYQRLSDQTLAICARDFVEPKLRQVEARLAELAGAGAARQRPLRQLAAELHELHAELLRLAAFWRPCLDDGVQISAAPLWRLFQHRRWQRRLRETWTGLEAGSYDWSQLAYRLWPERVRARCAEDRSLASTHGLPQL